MAGFICQSPQSPVGIGLRAEHYQAIDEQAPDIGWLEVHTENYFGAGGVPHHYLTRLRAHYPLSFHGVGLSLGGTDPLDLSHVEKTAALINRYQPFIVSEHLSWGAVDNQHFNDLLPLPYTYEALDNIVERIDRVQSLLGRTILIENPSVYLAFKEKDMSEAEFINDMVKRTGCGLLLDVNNVYVSAMNQGSDPIEYLDAIATEAVGEIHLAGHTVREYEQGKVYIDTHNQKVCDAVWDLYAYVIKTKGVHATLIEWDTDLPELDVLLQEAATARGLIGETHARVA